MPNLPDLQFQLDNPQSPVLPPQDLAARALMHSSFIEDGMLDGTTEASCDLLPLYAPHSLQRLLPWDSGVPCRLGR